MPDNGKALSDWLRALFASGWYTSEAAQQATNLPLRLDPAQSAAGYYSSPRSSQPGISIRITSPNVALHEYNHYFDYLNSIVSNPALRALVLENLMGTQIPFTEAVQRYRGGLSSEMQQFPGMYGNPKSALIDWNTGQPMGDWGGVGEMYARLGEQPWRMPPVLRQYYPQFTAQAFQRPEGRRVVFEDGSVGYESSPYPTLPPVPSGAPATAMLGSPRIGGAPKTLNRPMAKVAPTSRQETRPAVRPAPPGPFGKPTTLPTRRPAMPPPPKGGSKPGGGSLKR